MPEPLAIRDEYEAEATNRVSKSEWKMSNRTLLVFVTICVLTLMVALDSTSIGVALPVSTIDLRSIRAQLIKNELVDNFKSAS